VDHALARAKVWSKYAKDVLTNLELDFARNLTKLAQAMRPILKEESYLPFQSIYCTGLDQVLVTGIYTIYYTINQCDQRGEREES
jgi:hypothetical protein